MKIMQRANSIDFYDDVFCESAEAKREKRIEMNIKKIQFASHKRLLKMINKTQKTCFKNKSKKFHKKSISLHTTLNHKLKLNAKDDYNSIKSTEYLEMITSFEFDCDFWLGCSGTEYSFN
eukprot:NODE_239_length_11955_cov_0.931174.p11 type:complete len:120 gc:universal NODE_239_length_11955_cov_0.931174:2012-2371(+)